MGAMPSSSRGGAPSTSTRNSQWWQLLLESYLKILGTKKEQELLNSLYTNLFLCLQQELNFLIPHCFPARTEHSHQNNCVYSRELVWNVISLGWARKKYFIVLSVLWRPFFVPSLLLILCVHSLPKMSVSSNRPLSDIFGLCDLKQVKISTTDFGLSYQKTHKFHLLI